MNGWPRYPQNLKTAIRLNFLQPVGRLTTNIMIVRHPDGPQTKDEKDWDKKLLTNYLKVSTTIFDFDFAELMSRYMP